MRRKLDADVVSTHIRYEGLGFTSKISRGSGQLSGWQGQGLSEVNLVIGILPFVG